MKSTSGMIRRADRFRVVLIGEGIMVGGIAGFVVLLYRILLENAGKWLQIILEYVRQSPTRTALWFGVLILLGIVVGKLVTWEPLISGSGIPQLEGEMAGKIDQKWWKVLPAKFLGGFLCVLGGMSLGREGPSIQLGAMAGKAVSKGLDRGKTEEKLLLTCGASAGLAAAFHAPLAGVMFSLEEVHKNFSVSVLISVMSASVTADFLATAVTGDHTVFDLAVVEAFPREYYGVLVLLGLVLGVAGVIYNWVTLKVQALYQKATWMNTTTKIMIPFLLAGVLGFVMPEILGSGHHIIDWLTSGEELVLKTVVVVFLAKFLFSAVCFGSGAPGGIFFPLLVLGGCIGGIFGIISVQYMGLDPMYFNNIIRLAMAGYFTAIVRAPLTGIILIFEMTGSVSQMLSLTVVTIVSYIVATLLRSKPIYESLLERLLKKQGMPVTEGIKEKRLSDFVIMHGAEIEGKTIAEVDWPNNCLLVAIQRDGEEIIPKGKTELKASDTIVTLFDERDSGVIYEAMEELCLAKMEK